MRTSKGSVGGVVPGTQKRGSSSSSSSAQRLACWRTTGSICFVSEPTGSICFVSEVRNKALVGPPTHIPIAHCNPIAKEGMHHCPLRGPCFEDIIAGKRTAGYDEWRV